MSTKYNSFPGTVKYVDHSGSKAVVSYLDEKTNKIVVKETQAFRCELFPGAEIRIFSAKTRNRVFLGVSSSICVDACEAARIPASAGGCRLLFKNR